MTKQTYPSFVKSPAFWCIVFTLTVIGFCIDRWHLANAIEEGYRILVIDDETFYYPRKLEFREAHELHYEQAELACQTLFNRHPRGVDSKKRLQALFHPNAYRKAVDLIEKETPIFELKSMRQKVEISESRIQKMSDQSVQVLVIGQLIRVGVFEGKTIVETLDFEFWSHFMLNKNMVSNGRYPTLVYHFEIFTKPS